MRGALLVAWVCHAAVGVTSAFLNGRPHSPVEAVRARSGAARVRGFRCTSRVVVAATDSPDSSQVVVIGAGVSGSPYRH